MDVVTNFETLYLTAEQCVLRYNISLRQFQILVKRGNIPQPISIGSSKRWSIRVLENFESEQINRQSVFFQKHRSWSKTLDNGTGESVFPKGKRTRLPEISMSDSKISRQCRKKKK